MTLEEIEAALQARLDYLAKMNDEGFESPPFDEFLRCYEVLAQVKQAQHLEFIARVVDGIGKDMGAVALPEEPMSNDWRDHIPFGNG